MNKVIIIGSILSKDDNTFVISSNKENIDCVFNNKALNDILLNNKHVTIIGKIINNNIVEVIQAFPNNTNKQENLVVLKGKVTKIHPIEGIFNGPVSGTQMDCIDYFNIQINDDPKESINVSNSLPGSMSAENYFLSNKDIIYMISQITTNPSPNSNNISILNNKSLISDEAYNQKYNFTNIGFSMAYKLAKKNTKLLVYQEKQNIQYEYTTHLYSNELDKQICTNTYNLSKNLGFYYSKKDIINFHTAMKNKSLVILSGISGTGKTQLVRIYAKALGFKSNQLNFIPVSSSWTDDTDLLGFFDIKNIVYKPSNTGLVKTLINAYNNPNNIYIVLLDEMNLSNVEYYFSQFLSALELPLKDPNRCIKLYDKKYDKYLNNSSKFPNKINNGYIPFKIPVKNNILFVGTINNDESTHKLSDKVLDRSNIIHLHEKPFSYWNPKVKIIRTTKEPFQLITFNKFQLLKNDNPNNHLTSNELQLLDKINKSLKKTSNKLGIGWRVIKQINEYLCDLPNNDILSRNTAFDYQLAQRILTKIYGSRIQLSKIIGTKYTSKDNNDIGILERILNNYSENYNIPKFVESINTIHNKAKELKYYGFTL